jgi:hypothetical protein
MLVGPQTGNCNERSLVLGVILARCNAIQRHIVTRQKTSESVPSKGIRVLSLKSRRAVGEPR